MKKPREYKKKGTPLAVKIIHFIGIGGIGMSGLARWFLFSPKARTILSEVEGLAHPSTRSGLPLKGRKWAVSGSDLEASEITRDLIKEGVRVKIGHNKANIPSSASLVVYNRAIPNNNPELLEARRRDLCVVPYAKALGDLTRMYRTVAVTGSHGKSTTTALAALVLRALDPTVLLGTTLKEFGGKNIRIGKSEYLLLEADDFGGAFLEYSPFCGVITTIDKEHLDFYKTFSNIQRAFLQFISRITEGGILVVNRDDPVLHLLRSRIADFAKKKALRVLWYSRKDLAARKIWRAIKIFGEHNVSNALAAFALGKALHIPESHILRAIGAYRGSWRRMEYRGVSHITYHISHTALKNKNKKINTVNTGYEIRVYDDYAHHPTEIKATLAAFREKYPHSPLICVFQPHQAERLRLLFKEFQSAFDAADITLILPSYRPAGRDRENPKFNAESLVRAIQKKHPKKLIFYLKNPNNLKKALATLLHSNNLPRKSASSPRQSAVIVMMGAGDIVRYTAQLLLSK